MVVAIIVAGLAVHDVAAHDERLARQNQLHRKLRARRQKAGSLEQSTIGAQIDDLYIRRKLRVALDTGFQYPPWSTPCTIHDCFLDCTPDGSGFAAC